MRLGAYPTPVTRLIDGLGAGRDLWVKRDDLTDARYGGNKVRKLERILTLAVSRGVKRIVTVGGAGSHHVLATTLYGADLGIEVEGVLVGQPRTDHVSENLRAIVARARVFPATSVAHAATLVLDRIACGAYYVPVGGSTVEGALAYADAASELLGQVTRGELPEPRTVVVTLGSGGTAGGLAAGFAREESDVTVVGVNVSVPPFRVARRARRLARACVAAMSPPVSAARLRLEPVFDYLGDGYGHVTEAALHAEGVGARLGLTLDTTYTAKAFAAVLDLPPERDPIVYWHTLPAGPMKPLLEGAPREDELRPEERALLL
jgi:1-aminocyclopropane-1-carboxylate deaminase/D-cysteine desulfhydrase-like pyridoxal-dependent ACC family enzyme